MSLVLDEHRQYLTDTARLDAFEAAIAAVVRPDDVVCRLAQEGLGIGIVAESSARLLADGMKLVSLPVLDSWARRQHRVCVRKPEDLSPAARLLLDRLLAGQG